MNKRSIWKLLTDELGSDAAPPAPPTPGITRTDTAPARLTGAHPTVEPTLDLSASDVAVGMGEPDRLAARLSCLSGREVGPPDAAAVARVGWVRAWLDTFGGPPSQLDAALRARHLTTPRTRERRSFCDDLLYDGAVQFRALADATEASIEQHVPLLEYLVAIGLLTADGAARALAKYCDAPFLEDPSACTDEPWVSRVPIREMIAFDLVPVQHTGGLAIASTYDVPDEVRAHVTRLLGVAVPFGVVAHPSFGALAAAWRAKRTEQVHSQGPAARSDDGLATIRRRFVAAIGTASAPALADALFSAAAELGATDVHCDVEQKTAKVRLRVDGLCVTLSDIPRSLHDQLVTRLKVLAQLDVTERRLPQDGHLRFAHMSRDIDVRVATLPIREGERVSMRIAGDRTKLASLDQLRLDPGALALLRDAVTRPHGLVLATGPVGSGKTTTLYACIQELDRERLHIATIEDPVEIVLDGASQVEVNYETGLDFVTGLRALMRHDADALLLGEIRDAETAMIALRASLAGRMVFSTLHANSSVAAVSALRHFGAPSHVIASSLQAVIAQRLVRRVCEACCGPATEEGGGVTAVGCELCHGTGYRGRVAVFEVLRLDDDLRDMILDGASERAMRGYAIEHGLRTLYEDAVEKVAAGLTTHAELDRVLRA